MEISKIEEAIMFFEDKILKQGRISDARDEEHLQKLKDLLNELTK